MSDSIERQIRLLNDISQFLKTEHNELFNECVKENISNQNEVEIVEGIEIDKGFASSYFVNDLKSFTTVYENPYVLITNEPINSINQIKIKKISIIKLIKTIFK
jgi:chaperonin GroEL (HSP60 family)